MHVMIQGSTERGERLRDGRPLPGRRRRTREGLGCCCDRRSGLGALAGAKQVKAAAKKQVASGKPGALMLPRQVQQQVKKSAPKSAPSKAAVKTSPPKIKPAAVRAAMKSSLTQSPAAGVTLPAAAQPGQSPLTPSLLTKGQKLRAAGIAAPTKGQQLRAAGVNVPTVGQKLRAAMPPLPPAIPPAAAVLEDSILPNETSVADDYAPPAQLAPMSNAPAAPANYGGDAGDASDYGGGNFYDDDGGEDRTADFGGDGSDEFDDYPDGGDDILYADADADLYGESDYDEEMFDDAGDEMLDDEFAGPTAEFGGEELSGFDDLQCKIDANGIRRCPRDLALSTGAAGIPVLDEGSASHGAMSMMGGDGDDVLYGDTFNTLNGLGLLGKSNIGEKIGKVGAQASELFAKVGSIFNPSKPATPPIAQASSSFPWTTALLLAAGAGVGVYFLVRRKRR
jgi:hypothetical protein